MEVLFQFFSDLIGFPIDQVRYITLLGLSYPVALFFRHALHPNHTSVLVRHTFSTAIGIIMGFLCFGWQMLYLFGMIGVSYALLWLVPPSVVQRYSMVWAMGCISAAHTYRLITDFGGYHLDFTGPLMVIVQKVTLLGYALHDGQARKFSDLNEDQKKQRINVQPSPLEYASYMFNFHSFLAGPSCTIQEYLSFMDGSNVRLKLPDNPNAYANAKEHSREPSYWYPVISKLLLALTTLFIFITLSLYYDLEMILDPAYSFPERMFISYMECIIIRCRYYFIFILCDSINNAAGLGFSGYDELGRAQWDVVTNMHVWTIESALSIRTIANGWNVVTSKWLRRVCFERVTFAPNMMSFALSAWWHGFYPGYYFAFIYLGLANEASKKMRRLIRHHFQSSLVMKRFYDVVTWFTAHLFLQYGTLCLVLTWADRCLLYWSYYYYVPLIVSCVVVFLFPSGKKSGARSKEEKETLITNNDGYTRPETNGKNIKVD